MALCLDIIFNRFLDKSLVADAKMALLPLFCPSIQPLADRWVSVFLRMSSGINRMVYFILVDACFFSKH